jgi:hypothetical protein
MSYYMLEIFLRNGDFLDTIGSFRSECRLSWRTEEHTGKKRLKVVVFAHKNPADPIEQPGGLYSGQRESVYFFVIKPASSRLPAAGCLIFMRMKNRGYYVCISMLRQAKP